MRTASTPVASATLPLPGSCLDPSSPACSRWCSLRTPQLTWNSHFSALYTCLTCWTWSGRIRLGCRRGRRTRSVGQSKRHDQILKVPKECVECHLPLPDMNRCGGSGTGRGTAASVGDREDCKQEEWQKELQLTALPETQSKWGLCCFSQAKNERSVRRRSNVELNGLTVTREDQIQGFGAVGTKHNYQRGPDSGVWYCG